MGLTYRLPLVRCFVILLRGHGWNWRTPLLAVAVAAGPVTLNAQVEAERHVRIPDVETCERCRLEIERVAVIYDRDGDAGISPPAPQAIVRTGAGHFIVITTNPNEPMHFDANGNFLGMLGPRGEGPGEYMSPMSAVRGAGDTVWVFDFRLLRRTAWSPRGEYLDSRRLPARLRDAVILDDGQLVMSGPIMTPRSIGFPLHRITSDGDVLKSFGPEIDVEPTGHSPHWISYGLANAADGGFWAYSRHEYSIAHYTGSGELMVMFERVVDWFPPRDPRARTRLAEDGPQPMIRGVLEDEQGLLRVLLSLPDPDWRQGLGERELQPGFEAAGIYWTPIRDHAQVNDFAIEIIDPASGELLVSRRFDGLTLGWIDERHLATYHEDDVGIPVIEIFRVDFRDMR